MGNVEVFDQVVGLKRAADTVDYIDLARVAITGWSYGGYMSLVGIALRPDVFKVGRNQPMIQQLTYYFSPPLSLSHMHTFCVCSWLFLVLQ